MSLDMATPWRTPASHFRTLAAQAVYVDNDPLYLV